MIGFLWIIISYILGSFPSGYIFSRLSGKNILKIGWRKTSGSNVFKNVGIWQGLATGVFDLGKGYLAVYIAQQLGFSPEIQAFSGVAAVTGHNWSMFLKFSGGRGIGTLIGALLAFSPQILGLVVIPLIVLAIVWSAAIGTILFLALAIYLSVHFNQFETIGLLSAVSLIPIFIKRLSPIKEIPQNVSPLVLIKNRLIFDDDKALMVFRLKKIFQKLINNHKLKKAVLASPKAGWQAAKYGAKMARKPIEMLIPREPEKEVLELTPGDFKKMMTAAAKKVVLHQEEINRINVFPIADKDTGYNLAATLLGVEGAISRKTYKDFRELSQDIKTAVMINARGNAGMIYTGYLMEVMDRIKHLETIDAFHLSLALKRGIKAARESLVEPVDGTILDITQAIGDKSFEVAKEKKEKNIIKVLDEALKASQQALKETPNRLKVLRDNNVVDAGGLGLVKILEAWLESLKGATPESAEESSFQETEPKAAEPLKFRHEVVLSFKKQEGQSVEQLKQELSPLGDSLEVIESEDLIKFHIHTNQPEAVVEKFKDFPGLDYRTEDMGQQVKQTEKKPLGLVVDQIADLPREFLEKHGIEEVSFKTGFPDGEAISSTEELFTKMREALKTGRSLPTTSAPSFKEYLLAYERAFEKFENILVITISSKLSGAYSSARIARSTYKKPKKLNVYVFDCFTAEISEGLIVMRAQELISQGKNTEEIVEYLKEFCPKVTLLACVDDFRYIAKGGRLKVPGVFIKPIAWSQKLGIRPIITLKDGKIRFQGLRTGKEAAKILAKELSLRKGSQGVKAAIAHADNKKEAKILKEELEKMSGVEVLFTTFVSPVIGTHTGPGVLLVAFYPTS